MSQAPPAPPAYEILLGRDEFAERALELARTARREIRILSQTLDRRIYGVDAFVDAVRTFVLQHNHCRLRAIVRDPRAATASGHRLVELARDLTSYLELRELPPERQDLREDLMIADERALLLRGSPDDVESKYYPDAPQLARLRGEDFEALWRESSQAQELRRLGL